MTIEERFEKIEKKNEALEKQNCNLRKLAWGAVALAAIVAGTAGWVGAQAAYTAAISPASITTQAITVKDNYGRVRMFLNGADGSVTLRDGNGMVRSYLSPVGSLTFYTVIGTRRVYLSASDGIVAAYRANGTAGVAFAGNTGRVVFYNSSGAV